ncbi:MAG: heavy-metal-associated domain-containing protein [Thermodesulfovibrionales bacterium]
MKEVSMKVEGMSCQHCVMRVKKAVDSLDGIISSDVQIGLVKVRFDENKIDLDIIRKAISGAGYRVVD